MYIYDKLQGGGWARDGLRIITVPGQIGHRNRLGNTIMTGQLFAGSMGWGWLIWEFYGTGCEPEHGSPRL